MVKTKYPNNGQRYSSNIEGISFHVENGGFKFEIDGFDFETGKGQSTLSISADSEGWVSSNLTLQMHPENLRELASWLFEVADKIDANTERD